MSLKHSLLVVLIACCFGTLCHAREIVFIERSLTPEEAKYFTEFSFEKDAPYNDVDEFKRAYEHTLNSPGPYLLRLALIVDDATGKPLRTKHIHRELKRAALIYDGDLPTEELDRYETTWTEGPPLTEDMTVEQMRAKYGAEYWQREWGVQKVELFFRGAIKGQYDKDPHLLVTRLDPYRLKLTDGEKKELEEWKEETKKRLSLGKDREGYKCLPYDPFRDTEWRFAPPLDNYPRKDYPRRCGVIEEKFSTPWKVDIIAEFYDWSPLQEVPEHEFGRWIIGADTGWGVQEFEVRKWAPGYVLAVEEILSNKYIGTRYDSWVLYVSSNYVVSISCRGGKIRAKDLAKMYAKELPSTLPRNFKMDKTKWYRDEGDMTMASMRIRVETEDLRCRNQFPSWYCHFLDRFRPPGFERPDRYGDLDRVIVEKRRQLYDRLSAWWQTNREKIIYDNKAGRLTIPADADIP